MLPWLLVVVTAPILGILGFFIYAVVWGVTLACLNPMAVVDGMSFAHCVDHMFGLPAVTADWVRNYGASMQERITEELKFHNPNTPIDLNPLHVVEGILGWALAPGQSCPLYVSLRSWPLQRCLSMLASPYGFFWGGSLALSHGTFRLWSARCP